MITFNVLVFSEPSMPTLSERTTTSTITVNWREPQQNGGTETSFKGLLNLYFLLLLTITECCLQQQQREFSLCCCYVMFPKLERQCTSAVLN